MLLPSLHLPAIWSERTYRGLRTFLFAAFFWLLLRVASKLVGSRSMGAEVPGSRIGWWVSARWMTHVADHQLIIFDAVENEVGMWSSNRHADTGNIGWGTQSGKSNEASESSENKALNARGPRR